MVLYCNGNGNSGGEVCVYEEKYGVKMRITKEGDCGVCFSAILRTESWFHLREPLTAKHKEGFYFGSTCGRPTLKLLVYWLAVIACTRTLAEN